MTGVRTGVPPSAEAVTATAPGSAPGWPVVLYFHHVTDSWAHYTALSPEFFRRAVDMVLELIGPPLDPASVGPASAPPAHTTVLITFDDGYRSVLTRAAPILAEFGARALLFCVTGQITDDAPEQEGSELDYLSWGEVAQLRSQGHVIGAHTHSHPRLPALPTERARQEIEASLAAVTDRTGQRPAAFAYPYGEVPRSPLLPADVLGFATVRVPGLPWSRRPHQIRRNYLPTGGEAHWRRLCRDWREQWYG